MKFVSSCKIAAFYFKGFSEARSFLYPLDKGSIQNVKTTQGKGKAKSDREVPMHYSGLDLAGDTSGPDQGRSKINNLGVNTLTA